MERIGGQPLLLGRKHEYERDPISTRRGIYARRGQGRKEKRISKFDRFAPIGENFRFSLKSKFDRTGNISPERVSTTFFSLPVSFFIFSFSRNVS